MLNNPIRFNDPTGHRCEPGDFEPGGYCWSPSSKPLSEGRKNNDRDGRKLNFEYEMGSRFNVSVVGNFSNDELEIVYNAFDATATAMGADGELTDALALAQENSFPWISGNTGLYKDDCGGRPCVANGSSNILLSDAIFNSPDYYAGFGIRRPSALGLDQRDLAIQTTVVHELFHIYADAHPEAVAQYVLSVKDPLAFNPTPNLSSTDDAFGSAEESMVTAIAIYIVSGGQAYPGYQDQMNFVSSLFP